MQTRVQYVARDVALYWSGRKLQTTGPQTTGSRRLKTAVINSRRRKYIDDSAGRAYVKFEVNERRRQFGLSIFEITLHHVSTPKDVFAYILFSYRLSQVYKHNV